MQRELQKLMAVKHEADSDGVHTVDDMADGSNYTIHTEADHQRNPDICN